MKPFGGVLFLATCLLFLQNCSWKSPSRGSPGSLLIVADPSDRAAISGALQNSFGKTVQTPQDEPLFRTIDISIDKLDDYARSPIILLVAALDSDEPSARFVKKMLKGDVLTRALDEHVCIFQRRDPWATSQILLVLIGRNKAELASSAVERLDQIVDTATTFELDRLQNNLFKHGKRNAIHPIPKTEASFSLTLPDGCTLIHSSDTLDIVRFQQQNPPAWITISWRKSRTGESIIADSLLAWRYSVSAIFDREMVCYSDTVGLNYVRFANQPATSIRGLWQSADYGDGGPFRTYAFSDSSIKMDFLIDYALFAPGKEKVPYIWQLDAVVQTFTLQLQKD